MMQAKYSPRIIDEADDLSNKYGNELKKFFE